MYNLIIDDILTYISNPSSQPLKLSDSANILDLYKIIASKYNCSYEIGSSRFVIILKEEDLVLKLAYNQAGIQQNKIEYQSANDPAITDVIESISLFEQNHFALVNPYYQQIEDYLEDVVTNLVNHHKASDKLIDVFETSNFINHIPDHSELDVDLILFVENCYCEIEPYQDFDLDLDLNFWETFNYQRFGNFLANQFDACYDTNYQNFGVTDTNNLILLDSGIKSESELQSTLQAKNQKPFSISNLRKSEFVMT